jgi:hypothetical protein
MQLKRDTIKLTGHTANSLFGARYSLFRAKNSLFGAEQGNGCTTLELLHELALKIARTA